LKPCCRKLRAADSSSASNTASGMEIVPAYFMCASGGWMAPSGT